jgi:hypothetical protein
MKKAILISPFFFPEKISSAKYNHEFALELQANYEVEILCSHPFYPEWKETKVFKDLDGIKITRGSAPFNYPQNNFLRRALLEVWFMFFCLKNINTIKRNDLIFAIIPPSLFMIFIFFLASKSTYAIIHDLQSVHINPQNNIFKKILSFLVEFIEGKFLMRFEKLFFLSNEMMTKAKKSLSLERHECHVVYPPITQTSFIDNCRLDHLFDKEKISIVYSGALGEKQNPTALFNLAEEIVLANQDVEFLFFSGGMSYQKLKELNENPNIKFNDLVPEENLGELLLKSDIQIIPQLSGTSSGSLPSKLPNVLASGSAIFAIVDEGSEIENILLNQKKCFVSNTWHTPQNIKILNKIFENCKTKTCRNNDLDAFKNKISDLI